MSSWQNVCWPINLTQSMPTYHVSSISPNPLSEFNHFHCQSSTNSIVWVLFDTILCKNILNLNFPQPDYRQWVVDNVGTVYIAWRAEIPNQLDANKIFIDSDSSSLYENVPVEIHAHFFILKFSAFLPIFIVFLLLFESLEVWGPVGRHWRDA